MSTEKNTPKSDVIKLPKGSIRLISKKLGIHVNFVSRVLLGKAGRSSDKAKSIIISANEIKEQEENRIAAIKKAIFQK